MNMPKWATGSLFSYFEPWLVLDVSENKVVTPNVYLNRREPQREHAINFENKIKIPLILNFVEKEVIITLENKLIKIFVQNSYCFVFSR